MAVESDDDRPTVRLPPDLEAWIGEQAAETGMDRDELVARLLEASRLAIAAEDDDAPAGLEELASRVDALNEQLDEQIDDVRSRVLQVKETAEERAPADHEAFDRVDKLDDRTDDLEEMLTAVREDVETLNTAVDGLDDQFETLSTRLRTVASAVVELKQTVGGDDQLAELKQVAAREGFRSANCGGCGKSVDIGLLVTPQCPHCAVGFEDVTGKSGLFSNPTLVGEE